VVGGMPYVRSHILSAILPSRSPRSAPCRPHGGLKGRDVAERAVRTCRCPRVVEANRVQTVVETFGFRHRDVLPPQSFDIMRFTSPHHLRQAALLAVGLLARSSLGASEQHCHVTASTTLLNVPAHDRADRGAVIKCDLWAERKGNGRIGLGTTDVIADFAVRD